MTNDAILSLKDALRGLRYAARREAGVVDRVLVSAGATWRPGHAAGPAAAKGPLRRLFDAVFARLEHIGRSLFAARRKRIEAVSDFLLPIGALLSAPPGNGRSFGFTRSHYRAAGFVLARLGVENAFVAEHAIAAAGRGLAERHSALLARVTARQRDNAGSLSEAERADITALCAAVVHEIATARPIRRIDSPNGSGPRSPRLFLSPNVYCFCIVGIATAIVSLNPSVSSLDFDEVVASANLVVDARFERFNAAMRSRDPAAALAREFATVIPYLP